jgi:hypothetical protein
MIRKTLFCDCPDVPEFPSSLTAWPNSTPSSGPKYTHTHPSHAPYIPWAGPGFVAGGANDETTSTVRGVKLTVP